MDALGSGGLNLGSFGFTLDSIVGANVTITYQGVTHTINFDNTGNTSGVQTININFTAPNGIIRVTGTVTVRR